MKRTRNTISPVLRTLPFISADTAHRPAVLKRLEASPGAVLLSNMFVSEIVRDLFAEYGGVFPQLTPGDTFSIIRGKKTLGPKLHDWIIKECDKL